MIFASFFTFLVTIITTFVTNTYMIIFLRFSLGIFLGFVWPGGVPLLTEFCPTKYRGKYLNFWTANYAIGLLLNIAIAWL